MYRRAPLVWRKPSVGGVRFNLHAKFGGELKMLRSCFNASKANVFWRTSWR
jgi:hypothetical protein